MTPQEQQLLQDLTTKINGTVLGDKDPDAEQFLNGTLGRNPDALYILAQSVLVQNYALSQAQSQLDQLKQQLDQMKQQLAQTQQQPAPPQKHTSFLGNLLGIHDESSAQAAPPPPPTQTYPPTPQAQYAPVQSYPPANYGLPAGYGPPQLAQPMPSQGIFGQQPSSGGFLRSAMQTATGVAAGALAFQGIESLMGGFEHHAGYGGGRGFDDMGGGQPREEVVNNYYGDSAGEDRGGRGERHFGDNLPGTLSPDIEDRRDDRGRDFADSGDDDTASDDSSADDLDDSNAYDDSSSSDDSN